MLGWTFEGVEKSMVLERVKLKQYSPRFRDGCNQKKAFHLPSSTDQKTK